MNYISFEKVGKLFGTATWAVRDFDLGIQKGEFVSFLGPSGCGKTTTLRMLAGLERNTHGRISVEQILLSDAQSGVFVPPEKRRIGMVFQSYAVWPHMNVFDNVAYPLKIAKISKSEIKTRVDEILRIVQMEGLQARMPNELSGGQQQRVALARGLVMQPRVLLLDEPLSNLDAKLREKMRGDIRDIQKKLGLTVVYVTHDQIEANTMSDRMVIMKDGAIIQVGTPLEVRLNPINEFVADFIRAAH